MKWEYDMKIWYNPYWEGHHWYQEDGLSLMDFKNQLGDLGWEVYKEKTHEKDHVMLYMKRGKDEEL